MDELKEYTDALAGLRNAVFDLKRQSLDTRDAMGELATSSHLRSTLNLMKTDVAFRNLLELSN